MTQPKLIVLTGTLDAGKTTLLNELAICPNIAVVQEVAQDLIDLHGYGITQSPEFQDLVFAEQLAREGRAIDSGKQFILCDRGIMDILAFSRIIGVPVKPEWEACLENRYDLVTIFNKDDITFHPELYQVPFDMTAYRDQVDHSIRDVLAELSIIPFEITGTHENRLKQFENLLTQFSMAEGNRFSAEGRRRNGERF